jgi:dienelactone hydrolase
MEELSLEGPLQGTLIRPAHRSGWGIVVISGTSGRLDGDRARLFAEQGIVALAQRWFGGEGQIPGICEIALETFTPAIDHLVAEGCEKIAFLGVSRGAEAALLMAIHDPRIDVAIAISPSPVVWAANGPGKDGWSWYARSSWTKDGQPLPFVAYDPRWRPAEATRVRYRGLFEKSLVTFAEDIAAATIPIEQAQATCVLVAGGADAIWPSERFAVLIADRLKSAGRPCHVISHPDAGHRVIFPGEPEIAEPLERAWGGNPEADRELGLAAWTTIGELLEFR